MLETDKHHTCTLIQIVPLMISLTSSRFLQHHSIFAAPSTVRFTNNIKTYNCSLVSISPFSDPALRNYRVIFATFILVEPTCISDCLRQWIRHISRIVLSNIKNERRSSFLWTLRKVDSKIDFLPPGKRVYVVFILVLT